MTYEVAQALEAIPGPDKTRKERTVLELAQARAAGLSDRSVFEMPAALTCSTTTWHGRWLKDQEKHPGWKEDPAIQQALELAERRARWWRRVRLGGNVQEALDILNEAAPDAARQIVNTARDGRVDVVGEDGARRWVHATVEQVNKAATSILDAISEKTASKGSVKVDATVKQYETVSPDDWDDSTPDTSTEPA